MGVLSFMLSFSFTVGVIFGYKSCLIMYPTAMSVFYENIYFSCLLLIYGVCIGGCVRVRGKKMRCWYIDMYI